MPTPRTVVQPRQPVPVDTAADLAVNNSQTSTLQDVTTEQGPVRGYHVLAELGRGGMGVVFLARQQALNRTVAIKMIPAELHADAEVLARFRAEAEAMAQLAHPNIVQVFEVGTSNTQPYFAMEFVEGGSLADRVRDQPLPPRVAAEMAEVLARAIAHAHQQGILHRDLNPANVLLTGQGTPKITDFGLAKHLFQKPVEPYTRSGSALGTPNYMAPEQVLGQIHSIDVRSDVYGLGAILYELLTGQPPFRGDTEHLVMTRVVHAEPTPPRSLHPAIPRDLENICLKCLAKEPRRRYATAEALADDLRRFLGGQPTRARPIGWWERGWRWVGRRPSVAMLAASLLLVSFVSLLVVTLLWRRAEYQAAAAAAALHQVREQKQIAQETQRVAERYATRLVLERSLHYCERGEYDRGLLWLLRGLEHVPAGERDLEHALQSMVSCWGSYARWQQHVFLRDHQIRLATFSPDGRRIVTLGRDGGTQVWDAKTGQAIVAELQAASPIAAVQWTNDGKLLVIGQVDGNVRVHDASTGAPVGIGWQHGAAVSTAAVSPDGRYVSTGSVDGSLQLWDLVRNQPVQWPLAVGAAIQDVAFDDDGKLLAIGTADGLVRILDVRDQPKETQVLRHQLPVVCLTFGKAGTTLLVGCGTNAESVQGGKAQLWQVATGLPLGPPALFGATVRCCTRSRNGQLFVVGTEDRQATILDAATGARLRDHKHAGEVRAVAWSPDGHVLATAAEDGLVRLFDAATGASLGQPLRHQEAVNSLAFSPDGQTLLTASDDRTARTWSVATGPALTRRWPVEGKVFAAAFDAAGTKLVATSGQPWRVQVWDGQGSKLLAGPWALEDAPWSVTFSPDGNTVLVGGGLSFRHSPQEEAIRRGYVWAWDLARQQPRFEPTQWPDAVRAVTYFPDGQRFLVGYGHSFRTPRDEMVGEGRACACDAVTGTAAADAFHHEREIISIAVSPHGDVVATGSPDWSVRLWHPDGQAFGKPLRHVGWVNSVAFHSREPLLLTGCDDGCAQLWHVQTGQPVRQPMRHNGPVRAVAVHPEGHLLLTGSDDGTARLWHAATGLPLTKPLPQGGKVSTVAFAGETGYFLAGTEQGELRLFQLPKLHQASLARLRLWIELNLGMELDEEGATHVMSRAEWSQRWLQWQQQDP